MIIIVKVAAVLVVVLECVVLLTYSCHDVALTVCTMFIWRCFMCAFGLLTLGSTAPATACFPESSCCIPSFKTLPLTNIAGVFVGRASLNDGRQPGHHRQDSNTMFTGEDSGDGNGPNPDPEHDDNLCFTLLVHHGRNVEIRVRGSGDTALEEL